MSDIPLKDRILFAYRKSPTMKRRKIAETTGASYGYVRNTISEYQRNQLTTRGRSKELPFDFHGWFWSGLWRESLFDACPAAVMRNRHGGKRFRGRSFSLILHKGGRVFVYPFVDGESWRVELLDWLKTWVLPSKLAEALLKEANLQRVGEKAYAVRASGVPLNHRMRVKGVGTFSTDKTPFPDGTMEFTVDANYEKNLLELRKEIKGLRQVTDLIVASLPELTSTIRQLKDVLNRDVYQPPTEGSGRFIV